MAGIPKAAGDIRNASTLNQSDQTSVSGNRDSESETDGAFTNAQEPKTANQNEWLELVFDYDNTVKVCPLETNQNSDNDHKTQGKVPDIISKQQQCPDFKHIYNYLVKNELPFDEN